MNKKNKYKEMKELFKRMGVILDLGMEKYFHGKADSDFLEAEISLDEFGILCGEIASEEKRGKIIAYIDYLKMLSVYRKPDTSVYKVCFSLQGGYHSLNVFIKEAGSKVDSATWLRDIIEEFEKRGYYTEAKAIELKGLFEKERVNQSVKEVVLQISKDMAETRIVFEKELGKKINDILAKA